MTDDLVEAVYGDRHAVAKLLKAGADPNAQGQYGTTPLYTAAVQGEAEIVELLLDAGADPNTESRGESEGLPICAAASWGYLAVIQILVDHGADPNRIEWGDKTALSWAAGKGYIEVMAVLFEAGADPDLASPIFEAARGGSPVAVRLLLERGAKPSREALEWVENFAPDPGAEAAYREIADVLRGALAD